VPVFHGADPGSSQSTPNGLALSHRTSEAHLHSYRQSLLKLRSKPCACIGGTPSALVLQTYLLKRAKRQLDGRRHRMCARLSRRPSVPAREQHARGEHYCGVKATAAAVPAGQPQSLVLTSRAQANSAQRILQNFPGHVSDITERQSGDSQPLAKQVSSAEHSRNAAGKSTCQSRALPLWL